MIATLFLLPDNLVTVSRTGTDRVFVYALSAPSLCLSVRISCKVSLCDGGLIYQESGKGAEWGRCEGWWEEGSIYLPILSVCGEYRGV